MSYLWENEEWWGKTKRSDGGKRGIQKEWKEERKEEKKEGRRNKKIRGKIRRRNFNKN